MTGNHIFNVHRIAKMVKKSKTLNTYEKINQLFKGAVTGSPELIEEVEQIVDAEVKLMKKTLASARKSLAKQD